MFTKVLEPWKFHKFRNVVMNLSGVTHSRSAHVHGSTESDSLRGGHATKVLSSTSTLWAMIVAETM